ncbi:MAG: HD domain-containing phosphohydrolase [Bacilli bacterium]
MNDHFEKYLLLGDPVIVANSKHQVVAVNQAYELASGYSTEEIVNKDAGFIKSGLTPRSVYDLMKKTLQNHHVWKGIFTNKRPNGELWNSSITITAIPYPGNNSVFYIGVCRDIQDITQPDIAEAYEQLFVGIAQITEANDPSLEIHLQHVSELSGIISTAIGLSYQQIKWLKMASILHDVGKVFIPKEILYKPGKLTFGERELIKTHTTLGGELIQTLHNSMSKIYGYNEAMVYAKEVACYHHEQYNGEGYHRLNGSHIPLNARIVALADVVDALMSVRPYKLAWTDKEVYSHVEREKGKHFDPQLVDALLTNWSKLRAIYEGS